MVPRWSSVCPSLYPSDRLPNIRLSVVRPSVFSCPGNNLSKYQWLFTELGMCIDLWRSDLGLLMGKFNQFSTELPVRHTIVAEYYCGKFVFFYFYPYEQRLH